MTYPKTNKHNQIPPRFRERIQAAKDQKLKKLDLSSISSRDDENLTEIPTEVWELEQLEVLNLSGNQLTTIPESITKLTNLTRLGLSNNQLVNQQGRREAVKKDFFGLLRRRAPIKHRSHIQYLLAHQGVGNSPRH